MAWTAVKRTVFFTIGAVVVLPILLLIGFQVLQIVNERTEGIRTLSGVVLDQDRQPIPSVDLTFRNWTRRWYVPIPFTPDRIVERTIKTRTDPKGSFTVGFRLKHLDYVSALKPGYREDGPQTDTSWHPSAPRATLTLHLVSEALVRQDQIRTWGLESIPFPQDGRISVNLMNGKSTPAADSDITFAWRRLPASVEHGNYGKFVIRARDGGVWLWEQERLFAPQEGYEEGIVFFFNSASMNAYMKRRRAEFFLRSRGGDVHARVFVQIDIAKSTLSLRARVNASGNRFVDAKGTNFQIGVYRSLSENYLNPGIPWWIPIEPSRGQIIISEDRLRSLIKSDDRNLTFSRYFAGHYQTPADILESMFNSELMRDHYVPQYLAKNLAAPTNVLQQIVETGPAQHAKDAQATLAIPENVKLFLTEKE